MVARDLRKDWAAQERFCRKLGLSRAPDTDKVAFGLTKAVFAHILRKPWQLYRLFPALVEYGDCKMYLVLLESEARKVRTPRNGDLVDHILMQGGRCLVRESPKDWPELCGLVVQKLSHLKYYDEWTAKRFNWSRQPFTSDNMH